MTNNKQIKLNETVKDVLKLKSDEDLRQVVENISGYFDLLNSWSKKTKKEKRNVKPR